MVSSIVFLLSSVWKESLTILPLLLLVQFSQNHVKKTRWSWIYFMRPPTDT